MDTVELDVPVRNGSDVVCKDGILGGTPCIAGTRIPAAVILLSIRAGVRIEYLREDYPALTEEGFDAVLRWAGTSAGLDYMSDIADV